MPREETMRSIFGTERALIGMIHVGALPGSPRGSEPVEKIAAKAADESELYRAAGFDAVMIENMHDRPYGKREVGPEITAAMTAIALEVRRRVSLPLGVQVLAGANQSSLAVAQASGAAFVRVEGFVYAHVADEGLMEADAADLLRYRKAIGAENIKIFADIKKKHSSHAITADVDLVETAITAEFCLADGVVVTGTATGRPADPKDVASVASAVSIPTLVGSGVTADNLTRFTGADALIVGSSVKREGLWSNDIDPARLEAISTAFRSSASPT